MILERRTDVSDEDIVTYDGIAATTVRRALEDLEKRMPREQWATAVDEAVRREFVTADEARALKGAA